MEQVTKHTKADLLKPEMVKIKFNALVVPIMIYDTATNSYIAKATIDNEAVRDGDV